MRHGKMTYSVEEAARILGVSSSKLYRSIKTGDLPAIPVGRRKVIPIVALERMLASAVDGTPNAQPKHGDGPVGEDVNQITLAGHLTRDPIVRTSRTGTPYATFRLTVRSPRDPDGLHIQVIAFGPRADVASDLTIGQPVRIEGRLSQREWISREGESRRSCRVVADRITALALPAQSRAS